MKPVIRNVVSSSLVGVLASPYREVAPKVQEICERYGINYNTGPLSTQFGGVVKRVLRMALPPRRKRNTLGRTTATDASVYVQAA